MNDNVLEPEKPAPYGRACTNCARVKCRCVFRGESTLCERCKRLQKECVPSNVSRANKSKKKPTSYQSIAEARANAYQSLLNSPMAQSWGPPPEQLPLCDEARPYQPLAPGLAGSTSPEQDSPEPPKPSVHDLQVTLDTATWFPRVLKQEPDVDPVSKNETLSNPVAGFVQTFKISDAVAGQRLLDFRRNFLSHYPCIYLPDTMPASELRSHKPFLWLVAMSLTSNSIEQQYSMGSAIQDIMAKQVAREHDKSMDLLIGMMCFLIWCHWHKRDRHSTTIWYSVISGTYVDLDLHRDARDAIARFSSRTGWLLPNIAGPPPQRTLEERRVAVGMFILSSSVYTMSRKLEPIRWTPYLDTCCQVLRQTQETDLDLALVAQAECFQIINQITMAPVQGYSWDGFEAKVLPASVERSLETQIQRVRTSITPQISSKGKLELYLSAAEFFVRASVLDREQVADITSFAHIERIQALEALTSSVETWYGMYTSIPPHEFAGVHLGVQGTAARFLRLVVKLTTLHEPGWDLDAIRARLDIGQILDIEAQRVDDLPRNLGMIDIETTKHWSLYYVFSHMLRVMRTLFTSEVAMSSTSSDPSSMPTTVGDETFGPGYVDQDLLMIFNDDGFMADLWEPL